MPKKANKRVQEDIADAVEQIATVASVKPKKTAGDLHDILIKQNKGQNKTKTRLLWGAVLFLTAAVFVLWIIQTQTALYDIRHTAQEDASLYEEVRDDFLEIYNDLQASERTEIERAADDAFTEEKNALNALIESLATSLTNTSTTTTTEN